METILSGIQNININDKSKPIPKSKPKNKTSVQLNKTFDHIIENYLFGNLSPNVCSNIFKDGRLFSLFIEKWIEKNYSLKHISGCKDHDFIDNKYLDTKYDEKTFTKYGCRFCPSNMVGKGRKFDKVKCEEKCKGLIFCIVSNINFPNIKVRFVAGEELIKKYPKAKIPRKDHDKFFK